MADEYNFMSGAGGSLPMGAYQRATQLRAAAQDPYYQLNSQLKQYQLEAARLSMHERAASLQMQLRQRKGMAELQSMLAESDQSDPVTYTRALQIAGQYGLGGDETFQKMAGQLRQSIELREQANAAAAAGMVPLEMGTDYYGRPRVTYGKEGQSNRGLTFEERMSLIQAEQNALNERESMRLNRRAEVAQQALDWDKLKYMDQRNIKLYMDEIQTAVSSTLSTTVLEEKIDRIRQKYESALNSFQNTAPAPVQQEAPTAATEQPAVRRREFDPGTRQAR